MFHALLLLAVIAVIIYRVGQFGCFVLRSMWRGAKFMVAPPALRHLAR